MKIASIVGARPEFVQAAILSERLRTSHQEILIHTGQHYDNLMSDVFFRELGLPEPDVNLGVGSGVPSPQLARLIEGIAAALDRFEPDLVIVRGDTNSTLAGSLAARQNGFALLHVEAGMRSYDVRMPEETNRVLADRIADVLLATGEDAVENLRSEGRTQGVFCVGDVMYDTFVRVVDTILPTYRSIVDFPESYDLLTLHRQGNVDDTERLRRIIEAFGAAPQTVLFPAHPRTRKALELHRIAIPPLLRLIEPLSYLDMLCAERGARMIFTDSGGVQREAYYWGRRCVTLRDTTEWMNTVDAGWNVLAGSDADKIARYLNAPPDVPAQRPPLFGDGDAAGKIAEILEGPYVAERVEFWSRYRREILGS